MREIKDIIGDVYNRLTIISNAPSRKEPSGRILKMVNVLCSCGKHKDNIPYKEIKRGKVKSCGCLANEIKTKVSEGDTYGLWTVIKETDGYFYKGEKSGRTFLCGCVCGKEKEVNLQSLKKGESKSCGCQGIPPKEKIIKEKIIPIDTEEEQWKESISYPGYYISIKGNIYNYKIQKYLTPKTSQIITFNGKETQFLTIKEMYKTFIGEYNTEVEYVALEGEEIKLENVYLKQKRTEEELAVFNRFSNIKSRCYNENDKDYKNYGARGIKVCDEWLSSSRAFVDWSLNNGYSPELDIDRMDVNGDYSPYNCRYITRAENNRNMRKNVMSWERVNRIRYGDLKNKSSEVIAEMFSCCRTTIECVRLFKTWKEE